MSSADVEEFSASLSDLTVNSKPHINMLTMLAEDYIAQAPAIVKAVEDQLKHVSGNVKLPVLYLIDSIVKNVGKNYITLFGQNIVNTFTQAFEMVDEKARSQMYKLRQTWQIVFPQGKMYALDIKVNSIDPAWPITTPTTSTSIHLNPKFLTDPPQGATQILSHALTGEKNQQDFLKQKKELLELQKRKVELELMQTKAILEEQTKKTTVPSTIVGNLIGLVSKQTISPISAPIAAKPETTSKPVVKPTAANAALVAPVRIRDPRLRIKEGSSKDAFPTTQVRKGNADPVIPSNSTSLSNASNGQQSAPAPSQEVVSSSSSSPKRDKKKKSKESKSRREEIQPPSSKSREKSKLSRAEQVLENLKEEQRLTKIQSLGSDTVINKAKQHEQSKLKEAKSVSPKRPSKPPSPPKPEMPPKTSSLRPFPKPVEPTSSLIADSHGSPKKADHPAPPPAPVIQNKPKPIDESAVVIPLEEIVVQPPKSTKTATPEPEPAKLVAVSREKTPEPPPAPKISLTLLDSNSEIPSKSNSDRLVSSSVRLEERPSPSKRSSQKSTRKSKTPSPLHKSTRERRLPKRKRDRSPTPDESPKKLALGPHAPEIPDLPVTAPLLPEPEALIGSGHDTDLRLLTAKPPIEESPSKKAKTDNLDELFGKEDVDLRALPPPAPIISRPSPPSSPVSGSQSPERNKNWANLKRSNSEISLDSVKKTPLKPHERRRSDRFIKQTEDLDEEPNFDDPAYEERAKERIEMLVKNAEEQVSNGNITFAQYNSMLKEVITMNEKRKLKEAMKRDLDAEVGFSPDESPDHDDTANDHEPSHKRRRKHGDVEDIGAQEDEHKKDRDFNYREDHRRRDNSRDKRFSSRDRDRSQRFEPNRGHPQFPGNQPPMRGGFRSRDKFGRWPPTMGPGRPQFEPNFPYRPPMMNYRNVGPGSREVPPADPAVLDMIAKDPMKTINIDGIPREIRFYGETAVIMMAFDDPKELSFQPGQRRVTFNDQETISLVFNSPYQEVFINGIPCQVRLGAPTRELYINGVFYEGIFGGPPIQVLIGNQVHSVRLHGPLPHVKISNESRKDLVAGKVSLIVDGNDIVPIYLDAKPQRFDIGGVPYILRFVEALQTVVINGVPFKIEFGSNLPVPMYFHGEKHYLRFSALPDGIRPGYITIINMEGGRLPSPSPPLLPQPQSTVPAALDPMPAKENAPAVQTQQPRTQQLELLATLMPSAGFNPGIGQSYTVEEDSNHPPDSTTVPSNMTTDLGSINVGELLKKLVAVGIVPATSSNESANLSSEIVPVSFNNTESLKTKQPGLVHALYSGMQCSSCGVRFPPEQTGKYSQHLDWHFRQNRRGKDAVRVAQSRRWCYEVSDWIQYQEIEEKEDRAPSWFEIQEKRHTESEDVVEDEPSVPAGDKCENAFCKICLDVFDQFYNEEKEEWHLKRAIEVDGKLYHPLCHKDREERLESAPAALAKSALIDPTVEPELIEIPDDVTVEETAVLAMPIDNERVETIDLDSEPSSNSKDGQAEEPIKTEDQDDGEESDDDILGIEVLETKIETYELSDEEGGREENEEKTSERDDPAINEVDLSKVKKEKVDVVDLDTATMQPFVVSSIDGNVELEDAAPVSLPRNIKINIASAIIPSKSAAAAEPAREESPPAESSPPGHHSAEPPPPGEELVPQTVKPRLSQVDLKILPPVEKGCELSGLCSIM